MLWPLCVFSDVAVADEGKTNVTSLLWSLAARSLIGLPPVPIRPEVLVDPTRLGALLQGERECGMRVWEHC